MQKKNRIKSPLLISSLRPVFLLSQHYFKQWVHSIWEKMQCNWVQRAKLWLFCVTWMGCACCIMRQGQATSPASIKNPSWHDLLERKNSFDHTVHLTLQYYSDSSCWLIRQHLLAVRMIIKLGIIFCLVRFPTFIDFTENINSCLLVSLS